jgi:hypothetical protein
MASGAILQSGFRDARNLDGGRVHVSPKQGEMAGGRTQSAFSPKKVHECLSMG